VGIFAEEIVVTDTLGRRTGPRMRHTIEEKLRIVEGARAKGASVAMRARRHNLNANQVFAWRTTAWNLLRRCPSYASQPVRLVNARPVTMQAHYAK
jgi:transposase-like protein